MGTYFKHDGHIGCSRAAAMNATKNPMWKGACVMLSSAAGLFLSSCDVDKKEDGELPDVKVQVDGEAKLPKYEVHGPEVTVEKKKVEVEVPKVRVDIPKEEDHEPANKLDEK